MCLVFDSSVARVKNFTQKVEIPRENKNNSLKCLLSHTSSLQSRYRQFSILGLNTLTVSNTIKFNHNSKTDGHFAISFAFMVAYCAGCESFFIHVSSSPSSNLNTLKRHFKSIYISLYHSTIAKISNTVVLLYTVKLSIMLLLH